MDFTTRVELQGTSQITRSFKNDYIGRNIAGLDWKR